MDNMTSDNPTNYLAKSELRSFIYKRISFSWQEIIIYNFIKKNRNRLFINIWTRSNNNHPYHD